MRNFAHAVAVILAAGAAQAFAAYPDRPVKVVITFPAGSGADITGRVATQKLSEIWGQPVVVENRGGAGGSIANAVVAKAAPDGYTLLVDASAHVTTPWMYKALPYDALKDFVEIAPIAGQPDLLVVNPHSSFRSLKDLLDQAKANPGRINFASAGVGSGTHLNLEKFKLASGINVTHIPYKGSPEVVTDLIGGRVDAYWIPISVGESFIKDGKLRALAISSTHRAPQLPDVPTTAEAGVPGFEFTLWFGLWGPAGMSPELVSKINKDMETALSSPDVKQHMAKLGNEIMHMTPSQFSEFVRSEMAGYGRMLKTAGVKPQ
ncbi:MAG TPA: tripartite tricarboxylate transporter substrate binding protein [Burkholderiales bacterium]|nr:tripartite tricarboxylate transporter substrate binding protein [Burkholderiales bacterium]